MYYWNECLGSLYTRLDESFSLVYDTSFEDLVTIYVTSFSNISYCINCE